MITRHYGFTPVILFTLLVAVLLTLSIVAGGGSSPPQEKPPAIVKVQPDTAAAGDTLALRGVHFGVSAENGHVTVGGKTFPRVLFWSDTLIHVIVPDSVESGSLRVISGKDTSTAMSITVLRDVSFSRDVKPILKQNRCLGCHGGTENLYLDSVSQIMEGADDGAVVIPGKADSSMIIKKLSENPPFGKRMPLRGPYLPDSLIQIIKDWINQGAKDN